MCMNKCGLLMTYGDYVMIYGDNVVIYCDM